jgi:hypothetical protein
MTRKRSFGSNGVKNEKVNYSFNIVVANGICRSVFTISIADEATPQDQTLAESMKERAITTTFTGVLEQSTVLTLESLADRGAVTQVSFQWLEPTGWSDKEHNEIDFLDGREIKASEVIRRVSFHVHRARLRYAAVCIAAVAALSIAVLLLGVGVAWIRRGFAAT